MPEVIDCFDVSNLGIAIAVGSCIRFINGKPSKSYYRRFNIINVVGQNDFAMIGEIVRRRYSSTSEKIPDLILIDGGRGELQPLSCHFEAWASQMLLALVLQRKMKRSICQALKTRSCYRRVM